ncbi:MAG: globin [Armatimonadetes bacterium]|nr:globin [Armatimonadota bacterium]MBS1727079.1 group II truncated hemoglobin [Armatimonadota bacterium]
MSESTIPSPADYAGGLESFEKLTTAFYEKVGKDAILAPIFEEMDHEHPKHVAAFMAQCFGGGTPYSGDRSENEALREMVGKHLGRHLTEQQRRRWVELLFDSADEVGLPNDPEFRSAFAAKIEWGSRIAVMNSQMDENPVGPDDHIPRFGWGSVRGPWESVGSICNFELDEEIIP